MNWIDKNYPVGKVLHVVHPYTNEWSLARIVNHSVHDVSSFQKGSSGIVVQLIDEPDIFTTIASSFLNEDGAGL